MERKKLEQILDQVAEHWFIGIEAPTKFAKVKSKVAMGKQKARGFPQLMFLKPKTLNCPICNKITDSESKINLRTRRQRLNCGCEIDFKGIK